MGTRGWFVIVATSLLLFVFVLQPIVSGQGKAPERDPHDRTTQVAPEDRRVTGSASTTTQVDPRTRAGGQTSTGALPNQDPRGQRPIPRDDGNPRDFPVRPALALGGGGSKGAFQVGVLENLYARGLQPSIITGTSVGALNGAKLAEGDDAIDDLVRLWRDISGNESIYVPNPHLEALLSAFDWFKELSRLGAEDVQEIAKIPSVPQKVEEAFMHLNAMDGLHLQQGLARRVAENLSIEAVMKSGIKVALPAMERGSGDIRYFRENGDIELQNGAIWQRGRTDGADLHEDVLRAPSLADGVMASSAIPLFFAPWRINGGESYWDGAVREGIPIHKALQLGATHLIAILTGATDTLTTSAAKGFTLTIERVSRVGNNPDDGSQGDYYAKVKWGHREWSTTGYFENDRRVSPNWRFEGVFDEIRIRVGDYDNPDVSDTCDVSPEPGRSELQVTLQTDAAGRPRGAFPIIGDVQGRIGDLITVRGGDDGDNCAVEIAFRVTPGTSSSSDYLKGLPLDVAPLAAAMDVLTHQGSEVSQGDLHDLDMLDVLHEAAAGLGEGTIVRSVKSFPLPKDFRGQAYMIPDYVLIEPPFTIGELPEFDPEAISFNMELGGIVGRWTTIDFLDRGPTRYEADGVTPIPTQRRDAVNEGWLDQHKRSEIIGLIQARIDRWRRVEERGDDTGRVWRERYEALQRKATGLRIKPTRHSPTRPAA